MTLDLHNLPETISSTDLFDALEDLRALDEDVDDVTTQDIVELSRVCAELECYPEAKYGDTLIREDYFTDYIRELIDDCYDLPKEMTSGDWPWRHIKIDYEAAAEEAKQDYGDIQIFGETFFIRA